MRSSALFCALVLLAGCASARMPKRYRYVERISFRNCVRTDGRENQDTCHCKIVDWIRDAHSPKTWIAVCSGE